MADRDPHVKLVHMKFPIAPVVSVPAAFLICMAPAFAQESNNLPRFDALEQQKQAVEQDRFDNLERQRQRERDFTTSPSSGFSSADRALRDLEYQREFDKLRLEGDLERAQDQRERDLDNAALPNRRIAPFSSLVITDPERYVLPPAPPGHYYARLDGRFVLVDRTSELVVKVFDPKLGDPTGDVPVGPRPQVQKPLPIGRIPANSPQVITDFQRLSLPPPPQDQYYARVDGRILLVDAKTERAVKAVGG
jgi:Ni/Co efflux regulator RcnB